MDDVALLQVLHDAATAVHGALTGLDDWGLAGTRESQYRSDLAADAAAIAVLTGAGLGVLSEESGVTDGHRDLLCVLDPVDGSTNAARGVPWFATSMAVLDADGIRAAVVVNQSSGVRYEATRGGGARRDGRSITTSPATHLSESIVAFSGYPERHLGWAQFRSLGAAALDLCAVAEGVLDGFAAVGGSTLGCWDYLGGMLVCTEAGAVVTDLGGGELVVRAHGERRAPLATCTPALHEELARAIKDR